VLIGPNFKPFYAEDRGKDLGVTTWPPEAWKIGGGTAWGWISYDPELDLVYYGTGNPGPWNPEQRPGDNKWTSGIFARKPDTGEAVWFYQYSAARPARLQRHQRERAARPAREGPPAQGAVHPDRNGYVYVIDRATARCCRPRPS
jgi:glucose dehydrogenase